MYRKEDYHYHLPPERIAQEPQPRRDRSGLLVLNKTTGRIHHRCFADIVDLLRPEDILVLNNTRVMPGRLIGRKPTGGRVEVLVLHIREQGRSDSEGAYTALCDCLLKLSKRPRPGTRFLFDAGAAAEVRSEADAVFTLRFETRQPFEETLSRIGRIPLPPYIHREEHPGTASADAETYQTVYAAESGAVAAPTAGLHFTEALLNRIQGKGIQVAEITLHVGHGTFLPVRVSDIRSHRMHQERFTLSAETAERINRAKAAGGRVVAVGTTSVRTLEYVADARGTVSPRQGACDLFIYPGYRFKVVDALITNFHLPESTLLMLVSAFAGRERILQTYETAIAHGYRFYSYGDAMFIHASPSAGDSGDPTEAAS